MTSIAKLFGSTAALLALAACGGGGGGGGGVASLVTGAEEEEARVFSTGNGDAADVLASGGTLTAREVSEAAWRQDFDGNVYTLVNAGLAVTGDGNDLEVTVTKADGNVASFVIQDAHLITENFYNDETDTEFIGFFVGGGLAIQDLLDDTIPNRYAVPIGAYYDDFSDDFATEIRTVLGTETENTYLAGLLGTEASASYGGFGSLALRADGFNFSDLNANIGGEVSLTANFETSTIGGTWSNLDLEVRNGQVVNEDLSRELSGTVLFDDADIVPDGFSGTMSADEVLAADEFAAFADSMSYQGTFYGPEAEQVGGTMTGSATVGENDFVGVGTFAGWVIE